MTRDINLLSSAVRSMCGALINQADKSGIRVIVTSTKRSAAEQRALYAQGRRNVDEVNAMRLTASMSPISHASNQVVTHALRSMHEFGCAFDMAVLNTQGRADWSDINAYERLGRMGEALGLKWGGRFTGSRDLCHFEYAGGLSMKELMAGRRPADNNGDGQSGAPDKEDLKQVEKAKAGLRSSEFYLALLGATLPVLNTHLGTQIPVSGLMSIAGVIISYILSRTVIKRA